MSPFLLSPPYGESVELVQVVFNLQMIVHQVHLPQPSRGCSNENYSPSTTLELSSESPPVHGESKTDDHASPFQYDPSACVLPVDEVPDGGYGWVVVSACSLITAFYVGGFYSWGILQAGLANQKFAQDSTLAFVGSVAVSWVAIGAVPNSWVIHWLGARNAAMLGCFLLGFGQVLNSFSAKSIGGLFFTNGIVIGMGNSLCFLACGTLPSQWFKRRRGLANGLVFAGGGLGGCVQSIVMQLLIDRVGILWTFRIMGSITLLATVPAAMLLRERHIHVAVTVDWTLFKDLKFVLLFLGSGIATFPLLVPPFFIPMYASSINISASLGAVLLAVFNISSAIGRVGLGHLCDVIGPLSSLCVAIILSAISMVVWPESNSLAPFVIFVVINGFGNGGFFATMPTVVAHMYGSKMRGAFAMIATSWSVGYMLGAPIAGWMLEIYGGSNAGRVAYRPVMFYAGSMFLGGLLFVLSARHLFSRRFFAFA
ncbi:major facilitator superfamily domain-containing protein [Boletus reticuloceps]|uniref:Major facilitator superfamily domain-containing protein n=1 Tax=Boletus reticuloceps TaxID=495285 RepID=A0A8I2YPM1_9AGAM|nr:major facilitator superfamily domain-containing protein [Boletus reticuloceps]